LSASITTGGAFGSAGAQFILEGNIGTTLGIGQESGESIALPVPPDGYIYLYTISKKYKIVTGQAIALSSTGDEQSVDFNFQASCSIKIVDKEQMACDGYNPPATQPPVSEPPPVSETPSPTPKSDSDLNGVLSVRLPTDSEMSAGILPNILLENSINIGLMTKPKTSVFYGKAEKRKEYQLPFFWCATSSSILNQNLSFLSIEFFVNEKKIPSEYIGALKYKPNKNWDCVSYAVALSGWQESIQYILEMKISLLQNLNDGESDYPAGDYIYRITIDVP